MLRTRSLLLALSASALLAAPVSAVSDEGIALGPARRLVVTGRVVDAKTREPLPEAQIEVDGDSTTKRAVTGPDGTFVVSVAADGPLGDLSIAIDHSSHQQKYLEAVVRDAFRGDVEVRVENGRAHVKLKKVDLDLACGASGDVPTKSGAPVPFRAVCDGDQKGVELELRGTTVAFLAPGPFTLMIRSGRMELRNSANESVELRVTAGMLPR